MNLEKPGWKLTFHDEFDRPQLNDIYWYPAYRSGRVEYLNRCGLEQRWVDHNAHYVIEDGILKLRISEKLPYRPDRSHRCVSCITTSDHRIGATPEQYRVMDKFSQKYGWFEIRCRIPRGEGLIEQLSGFIRSIRQNRSIQLTAGERQTGTVRLKSTFSSSRDATSWTRKAKLT